jgi:hypothetical protein
VGNSLSREGLDILTQRHFVASISVSCMQLTVPAALCQALFLLPIFCAMFEILKNREQYKKIFEHYKTL